MTHFREVQHFRQPWFIGLLVVMILSFVAGTVQQLFFGVPWGERPLSNLALLAATVGVLLFALWLWKMHLVTEVRNNEIWMQFVYLWKPKRIPFSEILDARVVTYRPIRDYGGWGIRMGRKGMAYNVRGNRGVMLDLEGDKQFLVGSQRPEELAQAIQKRIPGVHAAAS